MSNKRMGAPVRLPEGNNPMAAFRKKLNISQQEAAEMLGLTRGTISKYERGDLEIPKAILLLLSHLEKEPG